MEYLFLPVDMSDPETSLSTEEESVEETEVSETINTLNAAVSALAQSESSDMELVLYSKTGMGDGQQASNPWLQEFPDPITRVSWDNYVTISRKDANSLGLINENVANGGLDGSYAKLTVNGVSLDKVPVIIQPGQVPGSLVFLSDMAKRSA